MNRDRKATDIFLFRALVLLSRGSSVSGSQRRAALQRLKISGRLSIVGRRLAGDWGTGSSRFSAPLGRLTIVPPGSDSPGGVFRALGDYYADAGSRTEGVAA